MKSIPIFTFCLFLTACALAQGHPDLEPAKHDNEIAISTTTGTAPFRPTETALPGLPTLTLAGSQETTPKGRTGQDEFEIPYTPDNPLTDPDEILEILEMLKQRHIEWLSRSGWYVYSVQLSEMRHPWDHLYWLANLKSDSVECDGELMYFIKGDQIIPIEIRLADGTTGIIGALRSGNFDGSIFGLEEDRPCEVEKLRGVVNQNLGVEDFNFRLEKQMKGEFSDFNYRAWKEDTPDKQVFVLYTSQRTEEPKGLYSKTSAGPFIPIDRRESWYSYDLNNGGLIASNGVLHLENGEAVDDGPVLFEYSSLEKIPTDLETIFNDTVQEMQGYLEIFNARDSEGRFEQK